MMKASLTGPNIPLSGYADITMILFVQLCLFLSFCLVEHHCLIDLNCSAGLLMQHSEGVYSEDV
jgi:hypothetical protein